jgi:glycerophosphoryl diester phosphodiesterase
MVWDHEWEHLRGLDAAYWFGADRGFPFRGAGVGIPRLDEVLMAFPDALMNIDLKQDGIEDAVAGVIRRLGATDRVLIGSFSDERVARFREVTGGAVATSAGPLETRAAIQSATRGRPISGEADAFQIPERHRLVRVATRRFVAAAHEAGKHVHVWTVNAPDRMARLLDRGVDGIVTDRPDVLDAVIAGRGSR